MTDWPVKTLGDICRIEMGRTPSRGDSKGWDKAFKTTNHWASIADLTACNGRVLTSTKERISDYAAKTTKVVPAGTLMMSFKLSIGKLGFAGCDLYTNEAIAAFHLHEQSGVDSVFLYWALSVVDWSALTKGSEKVKGATMNKAKLNLLEIPIPPLDEQKRIVALLDAATERVTELTACYEQARTHAKLLSGSMLVELLTSVEDSEPMRLGDIAELKGRIGWRGLTAKEYTKEGPLFVSVHSLNYGHFVDLKDAFHISQERYDESPEIMLKNNDILICKDGAGIGKLGMVGQLPGPATINSSLLLIRASKKVRSEFLYFYLLSPIFQNLVQERLSGSTTPHLYQRDIAELVINLPSLETQDHLIKQMWGALGRQGDLVECFDKQIGAMMRMRQSILEAAFAGDL